MLQSACGRKKGGRSNGDPVFLTCVHMECPGCPTSHFWWAVFFVLGSVSEFVTPADALEEKEEGQSGWYALFAAYRVHFKKKYPELWPSYYLVAGETGVLGKPKDCFSNVLRCVS